MQTSHIRKNIHEKFVQESDFDICAQRDKRNI